MASWPRSAVLERATSYCDEKELVSEHFLAVDDAGALKDCDVADKELKLDDQAQHAAHGDKERQKDDNI